MCKITLIDAFSGALDCFEDGVFSLEAWKAYARRISPRLETLCLEDVQGYDFDGQIRPVLESFAAQPEKGNAAHQSFLQQTSTLQAQLNKLGLQVEADVMLYLGLCSGAGWATRLNGRHAVLLGLEKIVELNWHDSVSMRALIHHELGHLWHFQHRQSPGFDNAALWQLYTEGMAMHFEQLLANDRLFFHQNKNGWLAWCEANRDFLFTEYHRRVKAGESVQDFFGDWCSYQGYSDVGYYLGSVLVWRLAERLSIRDLAELSQQDVAAALAAFTSAD